MIEEPASLELERIKRSYMRHLETGEPPNFSDLFHQASPILRPDFIDFVASIYLETGQIGIDSDIPDLQERMDRIWEIGQSLNPEKRRQLRWILDTGKPFPHLIQDEPKE